eukprot:scaffold234668_cov49-Prasinocladus_malaysianus.AAC.1
MRARAQHLDIHTRLFLHDERFFAPLVWAWVLRSAASASSRLSICEASASLSAIPLSCAACILRAMASPRACDCSPSRSICASHPRSSSSQAPAAPSASPARLSIEPRRPEKPTAIRDSTASALQIAASSLLARSATCSLCRQLNTTPAQAC